MTFSKITTSLKKPTITFTLVMFLFLFLSQVEQASAHGRMVSPPIRIKPGDDQQGFTITNGPTKVQPCAGNPPGPIQARFKSGQTVPIQWKITAAHRGTCTVQLSVTGKDSEFQDLKKFSNCADTTGDFSDTVKLPDNVTCDKCTLRWRWDALLTNELYLNCADISIGGGGKKMKRNNDTLKLIKKRRIAKGSASRRLVKRINF